jgi:hypothetical protein
MAQEEGRRARKRYKNAPSYAEVKAGIDAKEKAAAERKAARSAAKKPLTPAERYEQEKAARKDKSGSFSQHRMSGSRGHGSEYQNTRSIREEVLSYLLDEGFASDENSAEAIMGAMSEAWVESIRESLLGNFEAKKREQSGYKGPAPSLKTSPGYRTPIEVRNDIEPGMRHLLPQAKIKSTNDIKTA